MDDYAQHRYGDHIDQFVQYWPASASTELVLIHGGYWRARYTLELMEPMARRLSALGWPVVNMEYRRVDRNPDPWFAMAADVEAALTLHLPGAATGDPSARRRILIGHSAGGHLALWAAAQPWAGVAGIAGVVALAPITDLVAADNERLSDHATAELFGRRSDLEAASPRHLLPLGVPQYLIHGEDDDSVPRSMSLDYASAARQAGDDLRLEIPAGVDHFHIIDPGSPIWPTIEAAVADMADPVPGPDATTRTGRSTTKGG